MYPSAEQHPLLHCLIMALLLGEAECRGVMAAAAGGAAAVGGGAGGGSGSDSLVFGFAFIGFIIIGMVVNGCLYLLYGKFQKHVLGVEDPPESLIMDDKVKCSSGHNMMMFHVPANVSTYIKCGEGRYCTKDGATEGGFAAWYSCPVCSYRLCESCAEAALDSRVVQKHYSERTVENLFTRQFRNVGEEINEKEKKEKEKAELES